MPTIFSRIIAGEIPSYKIAENQDFYAFLDIRPLSPGHTLVVPKVEVDVFFELDEDLLGKINLFALPIARALEKSVDCQRVGLVVFGLEVPHAHMHLIPIRTEEDMHFGKSREPIEPERMKSIAERIIANLD